MTRATTVPPDSGSGLGGAVPSRMGRSSTSLSTASDTSSSSTTSTSGISSAEDNCRQAWLSLAGWLRSGRLERGMSIADIARTTKIQARILEDLEMGITEGLPADVFVRGFVRNYARCVGLSEGEALARYSACSRDAGPVASPAATAVAEMYAPTTRRISTVVAVAPGSPAAEVHAASPSYARPGYARAATSPGSALSSSSYNSLPRATTESGLHSLAGVEALADRASGRRTSAIMQAVTPPPMATSVVYPRPAPRPAVGSGLVEVTAAAAAVASVSQVTQVAAPVAQVAPSWPVVREGSRQMVAVAAPPAMQSMAAVGSEAIASTSHAAQLINSASDPASDPAIDPAIDPQVIAAAVAVEPTRISSSHQWPAVTGKKRKNQKRQERKARKDGHQPPPRAQTVRPVIEEEIFESEASESALTASVITPVAAEPAVAAVAVAIEGWARTSAVPAAAAAPNVAAVADEFAEPLPVAAAPTEVWIPKMPPAPRPSRSFLSPTLTIDDADPESASQLQEDRSHDRDGRDSARRTFLPPILLEQDRANRQGGLTLAVIILLIAATLTLSYLMRSPSSGGAGMTSLDAPPTLLG